MVNCTLIRLYLKDLNENVGVISKLTIKFMLQTIFDGFNSKNTHHSKKCVYGRNLNKSQELFSNTHEEL